MMQRCAKPVKLITGGEPQVAPPVHTLTWLASAKACKGDPHDGMACTLVAQGTERPCTNSLWHITERVDPPSALCAVTDNYTR